jgi:ubiquinone/menaquinone biosynthesis C-methylase UbiE
MTSPDDGRRLRRKWFALAARMARLAMRPAAETSGLVVASYDAIASGYDAAWTDHMRHLSLDLLDRLSPPPGAECLDLACGTGFLAEELARRTGRRAVGVDASEGMLAAARRQRGEWADFVRADIVEYLAGRPPQSADVVTCGWALGYTRPWRVVREIARVLRPGGRVGVIDNSLFSLAGVIGCSVLAFAERPEALVHVMKVRFLPGRRALAVMMRLAGLRVAAAYGGSKTYDAATGKAAIDRLTATGAAAGFEFAVDPRQREAVFARFAEIVERRRGEHGIPITHRYLAAIGEKP